MLRIQLLFSAIQQKHNQQRAHYANRGTEVRNQMPCLIVLLLEVRQCTTSCSHRWQTSESKITNKKPELMLMRRARAYSSSCSQIILVYFHPFRRNSLFCSKKTPKITKNLYFLSSRSFKVINVDILKNLVASACYDKRTSVPNCNHFHARAANSCKITFFRGFPSFRPSFKRMPLTQLHKILS